LSYGPARLNCISGPISIQGRRAAPYVRLWFL